MDFVNVNERTPKDGDTYHCNIRMKDTDEATFPASLTFFKGEWEISEGYEVVEWLDLSKPDELMILLLREVVMRTNIAFPENEQDLQWFEEKCDHRKTDLMIRLSEILRLGNYSEVPTNDRH